MMVFAMPVMTVFAVLNCAGERVRCMFLMKRMLRAVHKRYVALIGQHKTQRHTKHDGNAKNRAMPREGQHTHYRQ